MACQQIKMPDGSVGIICGPAPRYPRCQFCHGSQPATLLCDFVVGYSLGGDRFTCDAKVCTFCARHVEGMDICPKHPTGTLGVERPNSGGSNA